MESGPSKVAETIAGYLLPPACREEVLGDMRERYRSASGYFVDALQVIPCVIYSRICRTTDAVIALMEVASMYTAFVLAAKWVDSTLIFANSGLARLAIPPVVVVVVTSVADAYSTPQRRWPFKPLFAPILGFTVAFIEQAMHPSVALPASVFALGSGASLLLVSTLRLAFPPISDRPHATNTPAFWQKLELAPLSFSLKSALVPCWILLVVILYLLGFSRHSR